VSALNISVRHVHRVFSNQGSTVADWIRTLRLNIAVPIFAFPAARKKDLGNCFLLAIQ